MCFVSEHCTHADILHAKLMLAFHQVYVSNMLSAAEVDIHCNQWVKIQTQL